ncbi:magnesium/cobalt transporter CorA [Leptolyngbya sp. FACHB-261]|uniref:magnesium/cobalt transporter CorA n=1 Tax=Leptolyngbya sp. FACHB-261 TaxID=2692806 RepID=UPI0016881841|nr:magnesium/cobalt transporter CorA [Leptolyngbya sp. FACHB-261]MBD2100599.1 magnesium/cobalt transporter CorA [Leptolyngbya sp. FACHB-261]
MLDNRSKLAPNAAELGKQEDEDEDEEEYVDAYAYSEPGSPPGTLDIDEDASPPTIVLIDYNEQRATRLQLSTPEECTPYLETESVSWVDVQGLGSEDILQRLGQVFELHPLVLEDVVNVPQRPKVEDYDDQQIIICRMVTSEEESEGFFSEQVSIVLGPNYVLTVQEEPEYDCFEPLRERIRRNKGAIRRQGADYLAYCLIDSVIDGFFPVLEEYGERLEELEEEVVRSPSRQTLEKIHDIKRELLMLRRSIWPQRDAINMLIREDSPLIRDEVRVYLRDCYDHTVQVIDMVETYRELASSMMDVYLSSVSNRMNENMRVLTVFSTIFLPLTFIAGVYGMNFEYMPELKSPWGYPLIWLVMLGIAGGMLWFFKRKGWLSEAVPVGHKTSH